jgi:hypothetical protein
LRDKFQLYSYGKYFENSSKIIRKAGITKSMVPHYLYTKWRFEMKFSPVFNFRKFPLLCCLFGAVGFMAVANDEAFGKKKEFEVSEETTRQDDGCWLEKDQYIPEEDRPPCQTGVPNVAGATPVFGCKSVGIAPNKTCHWMYEDRMGCNNGGTNTMCDTVVTQTGTACSCISQ